MQHSKRNVSKEAKTIVGERNGRKVENFKQTGFDKEVYKRRSLRSFFDLTHLTSAIFK